MVIVETSLFTRQVLALLEDDTYRRLQTILVLRRMPVILLKEAAASAKSAGQCQAVENVVVYGSFITGLRVRIRF
jgi:hypothetical protein